MRTLTLLLRSDIVCVCVFIMTTTRRDGFVRYIKHTSEELLNEQNVTLAKVRASKRLLEQYWDSFYEAHDVIAATAVDDAAAKVQDEVFFATQGIYQGAMTFVEDKLIELRQVDEVVANRQQNALVPAVAQRRTELKLEKVRIEPFDGDVTLWPTFRDTFKSLVHDKYDLDDAYKLYHLHSCLGPKVKHVLQGFAMNAENYKSVWDELVDRYDDDWKIIETHLRRFVELPNIQSENAKELHYMCDMTSGMLRSLPTLGMQVDQWKPFVAFWVSWKLDAVTKRDWDAKLNKGEFPDCDKLLEFIRKRASDLANRPIASRAPMFDKSALRGDTKSQNKNHQKLALKGVVNVAIADKNAESKCLVCLKAHKLMDCPEFHKLSSRERFQRAKTWKLCFKCLRPRCRPATCLLTNCATCNKQHHALLCFLNDSDNSRTVVSCVQISPTVQSVSSVNANESIMMPANPSVNNVSELGVPNETLLGTAKIRVLESPNYVLRAFFDTGAQISLITEESVQRLALKKYRSSIELTGVGRNIVMKSNGHVSVTLSPWFNSSHRIQVELIVLRKLTSRTPSQEIDVLQWPHLRNLQLADEQCGTPASIDVILGLDAWSQVVCSNVKRSIDGSPMAQSTDFGWVLCGPTLKPTMLPAVCNTIMSSCESNASVAQYMKRLWQTEEPAGLSDCLDSKSECTRIFQRTHRRDETGRYVVEYPLSDRIGELGQSRESVIQQFKRLEARFGKNPKLKEHYDKFMSEYESMGHMVKVPRIDESKPHYYIPHHAVGKEGKFRVVFNASNPTNSGTSFNDVQLVGGKLQNDLAVLVMRGRSHRIMLTADVIKMYRQILVAEHHRDYQRIVWRPNKDEEFCDYQLTTVTYGTAAAPHLAVSALQQCAKDQQNDFPTGADVVLNDFYMDDMLSGGDTIEEVETIYNEATTLLSNGGFELSKFYSNDPDVVNIIASARTSGEYDLTDPQDKETSVLGLKWIPQNDSIVFRMKDIDNDIVWTKRKITSQIGRIYDPNGFISPIILLGKSCIQELWRAKVSWDEPPPLEIVKQWRKYVSELKYLEKIRIPRWNGMSPKSRIELHGFSDASAKAYAAVVYCRCEDNLGHVSTNLITSKTKVAPLEPITIPRMELNGALLLVKLMEIVQAAYLKNTIEMTQFWCDSTVVLYWIEKSPTMLQQYVGNRTRVIRKGTVDQGLEWRYVPTKSNPADIASRGEMPSKLHGNEMWWSGPKWLCEPREKWPKSITANQKELDLANIECKNKSATVNVAVVKGKKNDFVGHSGVHILDLYDKYQRLENVARKMCQFSRLARSGWADSPSNNDISEEERETIIARRWLCRLDQKRHFKGEIECCEREDLMPKGSPLKKLHPFLDKYGILRINGRLDNAMVDFDVRFPVILSGNSSMVLLILRHIHLSFMHAGVQQMLHEARNKYWILNARRLAKQIVHNCVKCHRSRMSTAQQLMGKLPRQRVEPAFPFERVGVDMCGPVNVKERTGRSKVVSKGYIAAFVCMATRGVHLELVSNMSSEMFLAAFRRMVSRRGRCREIFSDNGRNFVGANSWLQHVSGTLRQSSADGYMFNNQIKWNFNVPARPHQGGLWEAAIKAIKRCIANVVGERWLTVEEWNTLLTQVEACLNSRPLTPLTDDPNDLQPLTPATFITGRQLLALPDEDVIVERPASVRNRMKLIQQFQKHIWKRWQREYVNTLINRSRWCEPQANLGINDLVVIKTDNLAPTQWSLGRVTKTYPDKEGLVRFVDVRHQYGTFKRPIQKLGKLPIDMDCEMVEQDCSTAAECSNTNRTK